tara:strand:- start:9159 stop:9269 length:111 start_codon:yes stop_codon:yes gene_type:complete
MAAESLEWEVVVLRELVFEVIIILPGPAPFLDGGTR